MKKKLQRGIAPVETVLIIVIVAIITFVLWYVFHTKNTTNSTYNTSANTQLNPPQSSTNSSSSTSSKIVQTKTSSTVGQYLADNNGKTLYTYGADTSGVSNCSGSCLTDWPIYTATTTTNLPTNVTVISRSDSAKQYAYKGMPLYYFSGDTSAGMVTGNGVSNFSVAKP